MRTHKAGQRIRLALFGLLAVFVVGAMSAAGMPVFSPAAAKGIVKTQPKDDSEQKKEEDTQQKPAPTEEPKKSPPPRESSPPREEPKPAPRTDDSIFKRSEERRTESREEPSPERRGEGTRDVSGQVTKRSERRDPDYEFRRHYVDPFFYPYDWDCYRYYPYYERGKAIIIQRDTWDESRRRWRRTYGYENPIPGSLEEALVDIEATWWENDPEFLMWHIDPTVTVDVYYKGRYSHALSPRQVYKLTVEALDRIDTTDFSFISVDKHGFEARAKARHRFIGPDQRERYAYLTYYLEKVRWRWVIRRIDIWKTDYGAARCFIATAAFGTPMEPEVVVLRRFRDKYLMATVPGRLFVAAYYRVSPPIADAIRGSEKARAIARRLLNPVVHVCQLVVPGESE